MAVGLGKMLGFNFPENFRHPYISRSISEFWRRWHITLGSWFKSYVYIHLGGNSKGKYKTLRNLMVVWALTGLWHGANWNFVLWGLYFGIIIILERLFLGKYLEKINPIISILYSFILVMFGWVLFDTNTLGDAVSYFGAMFGAGSGFIDSFALFELKNYIILFILCIIGGTGIIGDIIKKLHNNITISKVIYTVVPISQAVMLILCTAYLVDASYNPFLYFRF